MQYWRPCGMQFVGDCMPFWHDGTFHLYYLLDEGHHRRRGGLGEHQWAHASTRDLVHWEYHPLALPVEEEWEGSICTGSVFWHDGLFHAFYATRKPDWTQHLCHAMSDDAITYRKFRPIPLAPLPEGCDPLHFRDPFVFRHDGRFQMLVTSRLKDYPIKESGGCLYRLSSSDLREWQPEGPILIAGGAEHRCVPECPDCFSWNGWHYLLLGLGLQTRYRMSRSPLGPWKRPANDLLDSPLAAVMKTAPFGDDRRIGVAWLGTRDENGAMQWGGNMVFRELVQHPDGTLSTRFVDEMTLPGHLCAPFELSPLTDGVSGDVRAVTLSPGIGPAIAGLAPVPQDFHLSCRVRPERGCGSLGLALRADTRLEHSVELTLDNELRRVTLADQSVEAVDGLDQPFGLEIVCRGDIVDVCVDRSRCLINRVKGPRGESLVLSASDRAVTVEAIEIRALQP